MVITPLVINIIFMTFVPLDSAHTELSIHAINSTFMKYPKWSLFSEQVTYGLPVNAWNKLLLQ